MNKVKHPFVLIGIKRQLVQTDTPQIRMERSTYAVVCMGENTGADHCSADQRLCFRYTDSTTPLVLKCEIKSV